jgi:hypothetical protein
MGHHLRNLIRQPWSKRGLDAAKVRPLIRWLAVRYKGAQPQPTLLTVAEVTGVPHGTLNHILYAPQIRVQPQTAKKIADCVLAHRRGQVWPWELEENRRLAVKADVRAIDAEEQRFYRGGGRLLHKPGIGTKDKKPCACGKWMNKTSKQCRDCRWPLAT